MFGSIRLRENDLPLATTSVTGVIERKGHPAAAQPCGFLDGFTCTVYPSRYHACRRFRCKLLTASAAGRVEPGTALAHVAQARRLRGLAWDAAAAAGVDGPMPAIRRAVRAWRRDRSLPLDPAMATLDIRMVALEMHLARHFVDSAGTKPVSRPAR